MSVIERTAHVPCTCSDCTNDPPISEASLRERAGEYLSGRIGRRELEGDSGRVTRARLGQLVSLYGDKPAAQLIRADLLAWQAAVAHLAPASRRAYVIAVAKFCRWMVDEGHIPTNPALALARVREPRRVPKTLTRDEVALVLRACRTAKERLVAVLMVECGLRCVEVANLELGDIDLAAGTLMVRGKGGHERLLPIPAAAAAAIEDHLGERGWRAGPLLVCKHNNPARSVSYRMSALMKRAGVHRPGDGRSAHSLRRTAASDVLERSKDIRAVQQMLGHANIGTTEAYLRQRNVDQLRSAMEGRQYTSA